VDCLSVARMVRPVTVAQPAEDSAGRSCVAAIGTEVWCCAGAVFLPFDYPATAVPVPDRPAGALGVDCACATAAAAIRRNVPWVRSYPCVEAVLIGRPRRSVSWLAGSVGLRRACCLHW